MLVVLLANISISEGLVNGSQGTIVGFRDVLDAEHEQKSDAQLISGRTSFAPLTHEYSSCLEIELELEGDYKSYRARRIFEFMAAASSKQWPVVRFYHRGQTRDVVVTANCYPTELGDEPASNPRYSLLSRTQIPLMAAWAMVSCPSTKWAS